METGFRGQEEPMTFRITPQDDVEPVQVLRALDQFGEQHGVEGVVTVDDGQVVYRVDKTTLTVNKDLFRDFLERWLNEGPSLLFS